MQYQYASYQVTAESITGVVPVSPEGIVNTGWIIFGGSVETDKINKVIDHGVLTDNWDEQDDDPEDYDPLAATEASYAYNWRSVTNPNKTGNIEDLVNKVDALAVGIFYGYAPNENELPKDIIEKGYAYVGIDNPYKIYNFDGTQWKDSGTTIQATSEADEEDITYNENDKLTFKDRNNIDGMGYVILRKNKSFAEQVTKANTIYEIRYAFTLSENITIPANCVLKFNGGSISGNKTLTGNNTGINAGLMKIFNTDVIFAGSWNVTESYPEWFYDNNWTLAINKCFNTFKKTKLINQYNISSDDIEGNILLTLPEGHIVESSFIGNISTYDESILKISANRDVTVLSISRNTIVQGISMYIEKSNNSINVVGIYSYHTRDILINFCRIENATIGIDLTSYLSTILKTEITNCNNGIVTHKYSSNAQSTSLTLQQCWVTNCAGSAYNISGLTYSCLINCAADMCALSEDYVYKFTDCTSISIISCGFESCPSGILVDDGSRNIKFITCDFVLAPSTQRTIQKVIEILNSADIHFEHIRVLKSSGDYPEKLISIKAYYGATDYFYRPVIVISNLIINGIFINSNSNYIELKDSTYIWHICTVNNDIMFGTKGYERYNQIGSQFFRTDLGKPIWWNGTTWVDATGTNV